MTRTRTGRPWNYHHGRRPSRPFQLLVLFLQLRSVHSFDCAPPRNLSSNNILRQKILAIKSSTKSSDDVPPENTTNYTPYSTQRKRPRVIRPNRPTSRQEQHSIRQAERNEQKRILHEASEADPTLLSVSRFDELSLHPALQRAITDILNLERLTQVQAATFAPIVHDKVSVMTRARTGTGKTLAYLVPALQRLLDMDAATFRPGRQVGILVVAPTRELVQQIADTAQQLVRFLPSQQLWTVQAMYGGTKMTQVTSTWSRRQSLPAVLVTTPGRLVDHITQKTRVFGGKQFGPVVMQMTPIFVLDEADRMAEGFAKECRTIVANLPRKRQTLLFSATLPSRFQKLLLDFVTDTNYVFVDCVGGKSDSSANSRTSQSLVVLDSMKDYVPLLARILHTAIEGQASYKVIVFLPTARLVRFFADFFSYSNLGTTRPIEIHSRMSQASRSRSSKAFREAERGIMFTSDVSARGMDYPDVTLVVQYGSPLSEELYLHRLGRTGRIGKEGHGIQVLLPFEKGFQKKLLKRGVAKLESEKHDIQVNIQREQTQVAKSHTSLRSNAEAAYLSFVAYYAEYAHPTVSGTQIEDSATLFGESMGLHGLPTIPDSVRCTLSERHR